MTAALACKHFIRKLGTTHSSHVTARAVRYRAESKGLDPIDLSCHAAVGGTCASGVGDEKRGVWQRCRRPQCPCRTPQCPCRTPPMSLQDPQACAMSAPGVTSSKRGLADQDFQSDRPSRTFG